ncbi:AMP-binding protein, partial [Mucilaginibacter sp. RCC_168]|uniref:AMP-binding protein n=1 Tax=Mucilaginibacter sp. RCC_168 TaxID=3239221 RepID=UPI0035250AC6
MIEHSGLVNRLSWAQDYYNLNKTDILLQKTNFCFDVSVWELIWPLIVGAKFVFAKKNGHKDNDYLRVTIKEKKVTMVHFVPSMLSAFLLDYQPEGLESLRMVLCSGEELKLPVVKLFNNKLPKVRLYNLYGPTEASIDVTYWGLSIDKRDITAIPIGRPIANTQIYILGPDQGLVPVGVTGE